MSKENRIETRRRAGCTERREDSCNDGGARSIRRITMSLAIFELHGQWSRMILPVPLKNPAAPD